MIDFSNKVLTFWTVCLFMCSSEGSLTRPCRVRKRSAHRSPRSPEWSLNGKVNFSNPSQILCFQISIIVYSIFLNVLLFSVLVLLYVRKECDEVFDALMLHAPTLRALREAVSDRPFDVRRLKCGRLRLDLEYFSQFLFIFLLYLHRFLRSTQCLLRRSPKFIRKAKKGEKVHRHKTSD